MAVSVTLEQVLSVRETLETNVPAATNPVITHSKFNVESSLNADSAVPATNVIAIEGNLTAGADTIDLTNLAQSGGGSFDATGKRLQAFIIINPATNTVQQSWVPGASDGYNLFGNASGRYDPMPGQSALFFGFDKLPEVSSSAKTIDITGDGTEVYKILMVFG